MTVQGLVYDFVLVNDDDDRFVFEMEIDDWMGFRNVIGFVNIADYYICLIILSQDCAIIYFIIFLTEIMWIFKWKLDYFFYVVLIQEDLIRVGIVYYLQCVIYIIFLFSWLGKFLMRFCVFLYCC